VLVDVAVMLAEPELVKFPSNFKWPTRPAVGCAKSSKFCKPKTKMQSSFFRFILVNFLVNDAV
jgi:hypothetical protein